MGSVHMSNDEVLSEVLDRIHAHTFKVLPDGSESASIGRKIFKGAVQGTWVHNVPHHGDLPVGDGEFHKYFVSQLTKSDGVTRTFVCVSMQIKYYKLGVGHSTAGRVSGYFEVQDFAAAEELLEPLALAMVPSNTIREIEDGDEIIDLI